MPLTVQTRAVRDREDYLYPTFQYFDKDSSGYITEEELEPAVKKSWNLANVKGAIQYQGTFLPMPKLVLTPPL